MRSWPSVSIPPTNEAIVHQPLALSDSYVKQRVLISQKPPSLYVCGITPYDATHLGHAATYVAFDLINRYLKIAYGRSWFVENITDIDDPLLERAARDHQDWKVLAHSQIELFCSDMTALRVLPPDVYKGVVESMEQIISLVQEHIDSGLTYSLDGDIYLDLTKIPHSLSQLPYEESKCVEIFRERGGDPDRAGKSHPLDPLLWRAARSGEPEWKAPFGAGRPGWHVECVAIALKNRISPFSEHETSITIQGGGSDLVFPHHFMTATQSESLQGRKFAQAYVHAGMIGLHGEKMSKSKGNLVFVSKLIGEGVEPIAIRTALMLDHYQEDRMWDTDKLESAIRIVERMRSALSREIVAPTDTVVQSIADMIANNLDTPSIFRSLQEWCERTEDGGSGGSAGELSRALDAYLGLAF